MVLAGLVGMAFQGSRGLYETTEGRYALAGAEMLETGDWWVPRLDGIPHWTKPPLTYWAIAGGMAVAGRNEWGARLFGALAFIVLVFGVAALGAALWDETTGLLAGLMYVTAPFVVAGANQVATDILLAMWALLAVLCYWNAVRAPRGRWRLVVWMWVLFGLGFLTKGPPALLSLLPILVIHVVLRRRGTATPRLLSPIGLAVFAVIAFAWFVSVASRFEGLMSYFLVKEVWARVFSSEFHRNTPWYSPATIYLPQLLLGLGAWILFWPRLLVRYRGWFRWAGLRTALARRPEALFLVLWVVLPLIILSISKSRLPLYVLPMFPAVALLTARGIVRTLSPRSLTRTVGLMAGISAVLLIAAKGASAQWPARNDMRALAAQVQPLLTDETRLYAVDAGVLFGLQFYVQRHIERVSAQTPLPEKFTTTLDDALAEIRALQSPTRTVVITRPEAPAAVEALCTEFGLGCERIAVRDWYLLWMIEREPVMIRE